MQNLQSDDINENENDVQEELEAPAQPENGGNYIEDHFHLEFIDEESEYLVEEHLDDDSHLYNNKVVFVKFR